jgi:hypothetical protein
LGVKSVSYGFYGSVDVEGLWVGVDCSHRGPNSSRGRLWVASRTRI